MNRNILERIQSQTVVLGDGGYLLELERRGWVDSGSEREKVGTGKGSGQFTPKLKSKIQQPSVNSTASFSMRAPTFYRPSRFLEPAKN